MKQTITRALSVRQPWAHLIINGMPLTGEIKDIENRTWPTRFRGRVYIHAAKKLDKFAYDELLLSKTSPYKDAMHFGKIIGSVEIVDCVQSSESRWFYGPYGFVLKNPKRLAVPVPVIGKLGFFNVSI